jgi:hypothetical protein
MNMDYLALARQGKNHWWRYSLGIVLIVLAWQGIGLMPTFALAYWAEVDGDVCFPDHRCLVGCALFA